jgi:hypothetical protein
VGVVEFALHPGGYVRFEDDTWLLVAVPSAPRGPLSLLVAGLEGAPLRPGDEADLKASGLRVGRHDIARVSSYASMTPETPLSRGWRDALAGAVAETAAPIALAPGLAALRRGDLPAAVLALAGRGEGLTPAGDDVLAGYAAWRHADGRPVAMTDDRDLAAPPRDSTPPPRDLAAPPRDSTPPPRDLAAPPRDLAATPRDLAATPRGPAAPPRGPAASPRDLAALTRARCSPLGLAYLRCAQRGELAEPAEAVLRAVRAGDVAGARRRARALSRWGASSGAAMLWGMAAAA